MFISFVPHMAPCGSLLPCYPSMPPTLPAPTHRLWGQEKFARLCVSPRLSLLTTVPNSSLWELRKKHCVMGWCGSGGRGDAGVPVGTGAPGGVPAVSLYSSSLPSSKATSCLLLSFLSPALPEAPKLSALPLPHAFL